VEVEKLEDGQKVGRYVVTRNEAVKETRQEE